MTKLLFLKISGAFIQVFVTEEVTKRAAKVRVLVKEKLKPRFERQETAFAADIGSNELRYILKTF